MSEYRCTLPHFVTLSGRVVVDHPSRLAVLDWAKAHGLQFSLEPQLPIEFSVARHDGKPLSKADIAVFRRAANVTTVYESTVAELHRLIAKRQKKANATLLAQPQNPEAPSATLREPKNGGNL
jgi:hypothetical protein